MSRIPAGTRLGSYEFVAPIGAGGMGEVYRARDATLGRDVAIKILPQAFASDQDRVERFEREARTLASLKHPHIAQIYGLERANDIQALVLELVDGETLADRIGRGPLPVPEAVEIAKQIASALHAAHLKGIVHRDLKPANVMVEQEITVKVLDFGLARAADSPVCSTSTSPTIASPAMTGAGVILGTAAYMSPEQAKGRTADRRSDVWAFGCVLYEMLTGTRAFGGEDVTEVITAVVRDEPDWTLLPAALPPVAAVYLRRCFEKDPNRRVQDIGDVRLALEGAFDVPERTAVGAGASGMWRSPLWIAAGALLLAAVASAAWILKPAPTSSTPPVRRMAIPALPGSLHVATNNRDVTIARDGSLIVYLAGQGQERQIVVRRLDSLTPTVLRSAERFYEPTLSPDSEWVAFNDESDFTLRKIRLSGGPPIAIAKINEEMLGATWEGDTIIYATDAGLWQVPAAGGTPAALTRPEMTTTGVAHAWPAFVPGGDAVLYTIQNRRTGSSAIAVLDLRSGESRVLIDGGTNPRIASSGHLLYGAEGTIHAVAFDTAGLSVMSGRPVPVVSGVLSKSAGGVNFDVASDGTLVYVPGSGIVQRQLTWVEPDGTRRPVGAEPRSYAVARLSPDDQHIALEIREEANDVWIWSFANSTLTPLTTDPAFDGYPVWSHDGLRLFFASRRSGQAAVFSQLADGTGDPQQLTSSGSPTLPLSITPDGATLIVEGSSSSLDLLAIQLQPPGPLRPLFPTRFNEVNGEVSPDGWIAYESDESGRSEIFVRPWPSVDSGKRQVSAGGGRHATWSAGGRELLYIDGAGRLVRVPVRKSVAFETGPASIAVATPFYAGLYRRSYDVSADGRRILLIENTPDTDVSASSIVAVFNWTEELKRARAR